MSLARNTQIQKHGKTLPTQGDRAVSSLRVRVILTSATDNPSVSVNSQTHNNLYVSPAPTDVPAGSTSAYGVDRRNPALAHYRRFCDRIKALAPATVDYPEALRRARREAFVNDVRTRQLGG